MATTLNEITQEQYDAAETKLVSLVRQAYPNLDLRRGTVLRDMLIRPAAQATAFNDANIDEQREASSLNLLAESDSPDSDAVNNLLANFNMSLQSGSLASGNLRVVVSELRTYVLAAGTAFTAIDGLRFVTAQQFNVTTDPTAANDIRIQSTSDGSAYYFLLPVVGEATGVAYELEQGTAVTPEGSIFGFISADAYTDFSGGVDSEDVDAAIARIPTAISQRALESRASIEARLRDVFESTAVGVQAISSQGYGDRTQLRDKHNPMGIAVGSRVDIYARTFLAPPVVVLEKTGVLVGENTYEITIDAGDAPGYYAVRAISEVEETIAPSQAFASVPVIGGYPFTEVRGASGVADSFHDISTDNLVVETAYTVYQNSTITVTDVPISGATHQFKVELYGAYGIDQIQAYVDSDDVRNLEGDHLVRGPLFVVVGLTAKVYHDSAVDIDLDAIRTDLLNYINSRSFVRRLTRSELSCIILARGAKRIDMSATGMKLEGYVRDASGVVHKLSGDSLDLEQIADAEVLLAPETCVFTTEAGNIFLEDVVE